MAILTTQLPIPPADLTAYLGTGLLRFKFVGVNFNSANTDNAMTLTLPTGVTLWSLYGVFISNASGTLTTATAGLFSTTGGGGTTLCSNQAITVSTATANAANSAQVLTPAAGAAATVGLNFTSLQFRVGTAQGAARTADVTVVINPL